MDHTWQAHRHLKKKNVIKWQLQGASSTKASIFRGARSIEERRRVEADLENQRGGRRGGGLGRRRWSDRQCKCGFHLLSMILCCFNWKDKTRQDKMICNEKMKVAPPPHVSFEGVSSCLLRVSATAFYPLLFISPTSGPPHFYLINQIPVKTFVARVSTIFWPDLISEDFFLIRLKYWTV